MKKIFTSALLAIMFFAFGCSKQQDECKISAEDFANATPENVALFATYSMDAELVKKTTDQKGVKEFFEELSKNKKIQEALNECIGAITQETGQNFIKIDFINKILLKSANAKEAFFFGASIDELSENANMKLIIDSPLAVELFEDFVESAKDELKLQKSQKDGISVYKTDDVAIIVKSNIISVAKNEETAIALIKNIKTPAEKPFAKTPKFAKLTSMKKDANFICFIDAKEEEKSFSEIFISAKYYSPSEFGMTFKIELGKDAIAEVKDTFKMFAQRTLPNNFLLKNSVKDSSVAFAAAIPEISDKVSELASLMMADNLEAKIAIQMLKSIGLKSVCFSCGELKAEQILKIQETMQPPEMFLKIDCENANAFFKNPMVSQMLNTPFISQMQFGENSIYTTMANIKFAPIANTGAFISTIPDLSKTMALAKNSGESLADNKDAEHLFNRLPSGNQIELYCDGNKFKDLLQEINKMQIKQIEELSDSDINSAVKSYLAMNEFMNDITKKSQMAMSLKIEDFAVIINCEAVQDIDFEKAVKILKELK
ncbi:MAG: hypothetical protein J6R08_06880 [Opitutales bacterium]|nr:hypothetical protein [Opitutales bacterium]